jgi:hypothetical protein
MMAPAEADATFWQVFAVFFPAVTGIAIGVSMSGDLRDPNTSIKNGTLASIIVTSVIYLASTVWISTHATSEELINNNLIMQQIARWPIFILLGVWAATLSSALGSVLAAPRTLQALAYDKVLPKFLASQLGSKTEPRAAVLLTTGIAVAVIWMGDLNFVAVIISMFFLNTYGMINLTAGLEKMSGNPSYRPKFKVPGWISVLGAAGCYGAMFLINAVATIVAILISFGVFFILERRSMQRTWGDIRSGIWFTLTRFGLLHLESRRLGPKNWRPNIVVFTGQPYNREHLADVSEWLSRGRGVVTFFQLLVGDVDEVSMLSHRDAAQKHIKNYIRDRKMAAFSESEIVQDFYNGALTVVQAHGLGGFVPNTVMFGWSNKPENLGSQMRLMRSLVYLGKSVMYLHFDEERGFGKCKQIDVWWGGKGRNAELMLLLAHLISGHRHWHRSKIRVLRVIQAEEGVEQAREHISNILSDARVEAEPVIIVQEDPESTIGDIIKDYSETTDLTFLGMQFPAKEMVAQYGESVNALMESVGTVLMVRSANIEDILET